MRSRVVKLRKSVWWWPERFGFVVGDVQWAIILTFVVIVSVVRILRGICTDSVLLGTIIVLVSIVRAVFSRFRFVRKLLPSFLVNIVFVCFGLIAQ